MILFNFAVDTLNNYSDYTNIHATDDYKKMTNIIGRENIPLPFIRNLLRFFLTSSFLVGLFLSWHVGWDVFFLGLLSFSIGIFYSWGPRPLNSLPVGEVASGLSMGFLIPLIVVRINLHPYFIWKTNTVLSIFILSLPLVLWIANVMLANNTCDLEEDLLNNRHTLVSYIGQKRAVQLFGLNHLIAYGAIIISVLLKIAPWTYALTLLTIPFVLKQHRIFQKQQVKTKTFICSVRILIVTSLAQVIGFGIGLLF